MIPPIVKSQLASKLSGYDLWDMWPIQAKDGAVVRFDRETPWLVLSAPCVPDPDKRHHIARIRLMSVQDDVWHDHGNILPDHLNPGSREWAGSAVYDPTTAQMTLFFTAAGYRNESEPSFAQRIFSVTATLSHTAGSLELRDWSDPLECLESDDVQYLKVGPHEGRPGFIKGFRDPAFFCDPADGQEYLLFTGTLKQSQNAWNGCIGIARRKSGEDGWAVLPPLVSADGVNNELERPHIVYHQDQYYLFWSTQRRTFADGGPNGPNGLYGMVSDRLNGPYRPLNGSGLVAANPDDAPYQAYSWWVTPDLSVHGFVDLIDSDGEDVEDNEQWRRAHFGGVPAPVFRLALDGDRAGVA
jgi:levansucrase